MNLYIFKCFYDINYRKYVNEDTIRIVKEELIEDYIRENNLNEVIKVIIKIIMCIYLVKFMLKRKELIC